MFNGFTWRIRERWIRCFMGIFNIFKKDKGYKILDNEVKLTGNDFVVGNITELGSVRGADKYYFVDTLLFAPTSLSNFLATSNGKGYGIITNDDRLCISINKDIVVSEILKPIYLMLRHKI